MEPDEQVEPDEPAEREEPTEPSETVESVVRRSQRETGRA